MPQKRRKTRSRRKVKHTKSRRTSRGRQTTRIVYHYIDARPPRKTWYMPHSPVRTTESNKYSLAGPWRGPKFIFSKE